MTERTVSHRAIQPVDGQVVQVVTMGSRERWVPFSDPGTDPDSLANHPQFLVFQTLGEDRQWGPAIVTMSAGQLVVTTLDTWEPAE